MVVLLFLSLSITLMDKPKFENIEFEKTNAIDFNQLNLSDDIDKKMESTDFDFLLIGYRAGIDNNKSSVIVKKNNIEYVVQVGDLLENKYRLNSVSKEKVIFSYGGNKFEIENKVGQ